MLLCCEGHVCVVLCRVSICEHLKHPRQLGPFQSSCAHVPRWRAASIFLLLPTCLSSTICRAVPCNIVDWVIRDTNKFCSNLLQLEDGGLAKCCIAASAWGQQMQQHIAAA